MYKINEKYFENIDSYEKAYYLGFIAADGCIHVRPGKSYRLLIKIKSNDIDLLKSFSDSIEYEGPIRIVNEPKCISSVLEIGRKKIVNDLINLGIIPKKSITLKFPIIEYKYISSFIRGIFDGDGCISCSMNKGKYYNYIICIAGSDDIIKNISNYSPVKGSITFRDGIYLYHVYGNKKVLTFMKWIYSSPGYKLNRKYEIFNNLRSLYPNDS